MALPLQESARPSPSCRTRSRSTPSRGVDGKSSRVVGSGLLTPPDNIGPRSTPNYHSLAMAGVHDLNDGSKVFAGQRDDGFFGDIGAAFDLVAIRSGTGATGGGKDFFAGYAVHTISLQVPLSQLDNGGNHVVGVWSATERPVVEGRRSRSGGAASSCRRRQSWQQVSRLGNPLINELLIPTRAQGQVERERRRTRTSSSSSTTRARSSRSCSTSCIRSSVRSRRRTAPTSSPCCSPG